MSEKLEKFKPNDPGWNIFGDGFQTLKHCEVSIQF